MLIDKTKCSGCGICIPYCPFAAISIFDDVAVIDQDLCAECGNCIRGQVVRCPQKAIYEPREQLSGTTREIRRFFSDPATTHKVTGVPGRGTEEVKTNDVTGRVSRGKVGIAVEMGRPCLGTNYEEVEKMTVKLAALGIEFEEGNPLTHLMSNPAQGTIKDEYKKETVVSAIIEFAVPIERAETILKAITAMADEINTVFSLDLICRFDEDGAIPVLPILHKLGMNPRPNAKINLGMGRPLNNT